MESDHLNIGTNVTGSDSVVTHGTSWLSTVNSLVYTGSTYQQGGHRPNMIGHPVPFQLEGNAANNSTRLQVANHMKTTDPNGIVGDFSFGTSYPTRNIQVPNQSIGGISFHNFENQEHSISYPLEYLKSIVQDDCLGQKNHSLRSISHGYGSPFTSTRWDINKFTTSPEVVGRFTENTGPQPFHNRENLISDRSLISESTTSRGHNELSLGLITSRHSIFQRSSLEEQCSEITSAGVTSYILNPKHVGTGQASCSSSNISLSSNSYKPVQLSQVSSESRYFHAVQEILADIASSSLVNLDPSSYISDGTDGSKNISFSSNLAHVPGYSSSCSHIPEKDHASNVPVNYLLQGQKVEANKRNLLNLLQAVDDCYGQCLDEIHMVISAFHAVTELDPSVHARFALPAISTMHKSIREKISSQILAMGAHFSDHGAREDKLFQTSFIQQKWAIQQMRKREQHLWKPQRGLPERSVSVLRAWMFQNFLHPYPKDAEKQLLALKSGLSRNQVSNWFINARVRLWKPMIEEMYAEMNRKKSQRGDAESDSSSSRNCILFDNRQYLMP